MNLYNKKIIYLITISILSAVFGSSILPLLEIHKLHSNKLSENRLALGKKTLLKRLGSKSLFLVNATTEMAGRLGCSRKMRIAAKQGSTKKNFKHSKLISSACKAKDREQ